MRVIKKIGGQILVFLTFLVLSTMLWGWLFTLKTDTVPAHKITVYIDASAVRETALAAKLEENLPENIRMVKAHAFSYAFFDDQALSGADIFIVPESRAAGWRDSFAPVADPPEGAMLLENGAAGILVYSAVSGQGSAASYITYLNEDGKPENFYLFFGARSAHYAANDNAVDNAAAELAAVFLDLE